MVTVPGFTVSSMDSLVPGLLAAVEDGRDGDALELVEDLLEHDNATIAILKVAQYLNVLRENPEMSAARLALIAASADSRASDDDNNEEDVSPEPAVGKAFIDADEATEMLVSAIESTLNGDEEAIPRLADSLATWRRNTGGQELLVRNSLTIAAILVNNMALTSMLHKNADIAQLTEHAFATARAAMRSEPLPNLFELPE